MLSNKYLNLGVQLFVFILIPSSNIRSPNPQLYIVVIRDFEMIQISFILFTVPTVNQFTLLIQTLALLSVSERLLAV